jgi:hypothetical protein
MKDISTEILLIIFKYLHYKQKVQCMLTCRKWATILQAGLFLETMVLVGSFDKHNYNALTTYLQTTPEQHGQQCKRLVVQCHLGQVCDYSKALQHFPNLTHLYLDGDDIGETYFEEYHLKNLQIWRDRLNTIQVNGCGGTFLQILDSGTFKALTTLDVGSNAMSSYKRIHLINGLKNTPNLIRLSLNYLSIDVEDLENLHNHLPELHALILKTKEIKSHLEISEKTQPANNLKSLKIIQHQRGCIMTPDIKQYIAVKYSQLVEFTILQPDHAINDISKQIADMTVQLFPTMGNTLKSLELELPCPPTDHHDFLTPLNLTHFSASLMLSHALLSSWILPTTLHAIHSLKLKQVPPLQFSIFKPFSELKVLELDFEEKSGSKYDVEFCQILHHDLPDKLESLGLGFAKVHIDIMCDGAPPNIRQLKLKRSELSKHMDQYISQHLKGLDSLYLDSCKIGFITTKRDRLGITRIIKDHGKPRFRLADHQLKVVSIKVSNEHVKRGRQKETHYEIYSLPTSLKLIVGGNTHCYHLPMGESGFDDCGKMYTNSRGETRIRLEPFKLYSGENSDTIHDRAIQRAHDPAPFHVNASYFEFKCAGVQTLYFNGCLLL